MECSGRIDGTVLCEKSGDVKVLNGARKLWMFIGSDKECAQRASRRGTDVIQR